MIHPVWSAVHARNAPDAREGGFAPGAAIGLATMGLAAFTIATDLMSLGVILPKIEAHFDAAVSTAQWVVNAYALAFGVLIVTGGRLADLFGRRRLLFAGTALFGLASLIAGASPGIFWLIGARVLMGVGAAMLFPPMLSISYALAPKGKEALAGGIVLGAMGLGTASGPLIGGALAEFANWRWVLLVNAPLAAAILVLAWLEIRIPRLPKRHQQVDYAGVATLSLSLIALLVALDQAGDWGFGNPWIIALLAASALLLAAFVFVERRAGEHALVPAFVVRNRTVSASLAARILVGGTIFVSAVYIPEYLEKALGYSPLRAGLGMLPMMLGFAVISFAAGRAYPRFGAKFMGSGGIGLMVAGSGVFLLFVAHAGYLELLPGLLLVGAGYALCATALNTASVLALPPAHASLAGAMLYMGQLVGGSIGLGSYTTILTAVSDARIRATDLAAHLTGTQIDAVGRLLAGSESARAFLVGFPQSAAALEKLAREAFATGMRQGFVLLLVMGFLSMLVTAIYVGEWPGARRTDSGGEGAK